ncbi:Bifunctional inhibitor/lipid-transfer protein/seed storage 2S albumin superfamily protein [Abeliophyllum distichum]|uniref:Bifunctional inhibitor/lipid-transfer protein/seed storage 2S albumin superfamily protein n=1 Tax=Abeliophyllum distichum TaxID=126358 RepID=A0ABD1QIK4_9LAMI
MVEANRASIFLVLVALFFIATVNGDTTTTICKVKVSELAECLPAIAGKSPSKPTKSCCAAIGKADLHCLCNYKSEFTKFGDPTKAMALPKQCGLKLPRECNKKFF